MAAAVFLDHLIVPARDRKKSAELLAEVLGVSWSEQGVGPFCPVYVNGGLTLDFDEWSEPVPVQHYCFRMGDAEFDAVVRRLVELHIPYRSTPHGPVDSAINTHHGGRIVYWSEPDGHVWEALTLSYARERRADDISATRTHKSRLSNIIIDCQTDDIDAAAAFWAAAIGRVAETGAEASEPYRLLEGPGDEMKILVQAVQHPSRVHLDIETDDVEAEATRLEKLGAKRVRKINTWWVMEAPTGQRFCVVRPQRVDFEEKANVWRGEGDE